MPRVGPVSGGGRGQQGVTGNVWVLLRPQVTPASPAGNTCGELGEGGNRDYIFRDNALLYESLFQTSSMASGHHGDTRTNKPAMCDDRVSPLSDHHADKASAGSPIG